MSIALFGASTLVLQHKEHVTSLLGLGGSDLVCSLGLAGARSVTAAAVLLLQGILLFKRANPLQKQELHKSGLNLAKVALIWVAVSMAIYRCQQECDPSTFMSLEQHLYRFQWYLRLFAAASIMYGTVLAALGGMKRSGAAIAPAASGRSAPDSAHAQGQEAQPAGAQAVGTAKALSLWPDAVCEAAGLQGRLQGLLGDRAVGLLRFVGGPAVLLLLCAWWLPQHPMLRRMLLR